MTETVEFLNSLVSWLNRQVHTLKPFPKWCALIVGGFFIVVFTVVFMVLLAMKWVVKSAFQEPKGAFAGAIICLCMCLVFLWPRQRRFIGADKPSSTENVTVVTGSLAGMKLGDLYGDYLHGGGSVPDTIIVNFHDRLSAMWDKKLKRFPKSPGVVSRTGKEVLEDYQFRTLVTLEEYRSHVDRISDELHSSIDWKEVGKNRALDKKELNQVKDVMKNFRGNEMLSYALAEIMPTTRGDINVSMFDLLLQNAGREYVESIPAMGDSRTSFGLYQFTSYAIYDTPERKEAASELNTCLPSGICIPGSVKYLRGDDHHRAAWLFALANICSLVKRGIDVSSWDSREILGYVAMAHHAPANAIKWYTGGVRVARMQAYRARAWANYRALKRYRGQVGVPHTAELLFLFKNDIDLFRILF